VQEELFTLPATNIAQLELFGSKAHSDKSKPQVKKCSKCLQLLHISAFRSRDRGAYLRTECKNCNSKLDQERKLLKDKYGVAPDGWKCEICGRTKEQCRGEGGESVSPFVIDHNHDTGEFRSWICHKCNRGLGAFNDEPILLEKAFRYLTITKNEPSEKAIKALEDKGIKI
tara:strand:- start:123 stop:635 length:513 start_codon:yes stop_codon:yes gene_type:complete